MRQPGPVGGHAVAAVDGAHRDRVLVGALVAHDAHALHRQQHRETLPERRVQPGAPDLIDDDRVGQAQQLQPLAGDGADDAHGEAGPGKRLPDDELLLEAEVAAEHADLVLEELAQRLDEREPHVLRAARPRCDGS